MLNLTRTSGIIEWELPPNKKLKALANGNVSQPVITSSKLIIQTLKQGVKYVQI